MLQLLSATRSFLYETAGAWQPGELWALRAKNLNIIYRFSCQDSENLNNVDTVVSPSFPLTFCLCYVSSQNLVFFLNFKFLVVCRIGFVLPTFISVRVTWPDWTILCFLYSWWRDISPGGFLSRMNLDNHLGVKWIPALLSSSSFDLANSNKFNFHAGILNAAQNVPTSDFLMENGCISLKISS